MRSGRSDADGCVIFLHIGKTGGVTLRRALKWKYPSRMLYLESLTKPLEELEKVPLSERRRARVVAGHLHYGVHKYIPQRCEYITLVREPVARVISHYYYVRGHPKHWLHDELLGADMGLDEFVRTFRDDPSVDNHQTRVLSGRGGGEVSSGKWPKLDSEALEEAKRNLERFLVVGLTERFDESFILLRRALGWKLPFYATANVATRPKPAAESAIELIRERNQLDLELYNFADKLLSAAIAEQGASFPREVAAFKVLNQIPNKVRPHTSGRVRRVMQSGLPR